MNQQAEMTRTLLHHVNTDDYKPGSSWVITTMVDAPMISDVMETALRRHVMDRRDRDDDSTKWYHCEGWAAVLDLHRHGHHSDAVQLAEFLYWCDHQANGRVCGFWEIERRVS